MNVRAALAWVVAVTFTLASTLLGAGLEEVFDTVIYGLMAIALATSGLLIVSRQAGHRIGWLFCGLAVYYAVTEFAEAYGLRAADEGWPVGEVGDWIISWSWIGEFAVWLLIFVLFPDGHLPDRRWRIVLWLGIAGGTLAIPGYALSAGDRSEFASGQNPFFVDSPLIGVLFFVGMALLLTALVGAVVSLVLRLRRAQGVERHQLKWFAYAAASVGVVAPFAVALWNQTIIVEALMGFTFLTLPTAAGIAILRYRLYAIDIVINRTLVYGTLTLILGAAYLTSILLLQLALNPLMQGSGLAIAASTLAVAALFRPARRRIQAVVDRRFYRRRYDAARTIEAFGAHLRHELDLDSLADDLLSVVRDTMQPNHVSLWLRRSVP